LFIGERSRKWNDYRRKGNQRKPKLTKKGIKKVAGKRKKKSPVVPIDFSQKLPKLGQLQTAKRSFQDVWAASKESEVKMKDKQRKADFMLELIKAGKSKEEIKEFMAMLDDKGDGNSA
jgi:23S rRNA G2069 N7-methylase RlmK/C1962 C5-methylase RlmI